MVDRKIVPFDEFYYQLKLMHLFQKHPVFSYIPLFRLYIPGNAYEKHYYFNSINYNFFSVISLESIETQSLV
jgi:hypothetical protein